MLDKIIYKIYNKKYTSFWYENNNNETKVLNTYCSTDYIQDHAAAIIENGHFTSYYRIGRS